MKDAIHYRSGGDHRSKIYNLYYPKYPIPTTGINLVLWKKKNKNMPSSTSLLLSPMLG